MDWSSLFFKRYGDRTNSLLLLYPGFETFQPSQDDACPGVIRYVETAHARIAASEPLAAPHDRADLLERFAAASPKPVSVFPVGEDLARDLAARGFRVRQAGAEPIFNLPSYFASTCDPLSVSPVARALKKRGGEVVEIAWEALRRDQALLAAMEAMTEEWLASKPCLPLGFLSVTRPFALAERKKYFILRARGELCAFIAAAPFYRDGAPRGYYFADIVRSPQAKAGANDLLIVEAMRLLHLQGAAEARLGMAPLARLGPGAPWLFSWLFKNWTFGYNVQPLAEYKQKFEPTRWEPLYMASSKPGLLRAMRDALEAHFPDGAGRAAVCAAQSAWGKHLALTPEADRAFAPYRAPAPQTLAEYLQRTKYTTLLVACFTLLHLARRTFPDVEALYARSAYIPGDITWLGVFVGPLFHNHWLLSLIHI